MTGIQPNGTMLTIYKGGNGTVAFYTTLDGYVVLHEPDGGYYYAKFGSDGLAPTEQQAHDPAERTPEEQAFVAASAITAEQAYASPTMHRSPLKATARTTSGLGEYGKTANGTVSSIGNITIPVIMVEFPNRAFQETSTIDKLSRFLNEEGYSDETYTAGSVRDYFLAQSNNMFRPTFNVVAKVKASHDYAYYGGNSSSRRDTCLTNLIKEAIDSALYAGVDFSTMLVNNKVPLVSVILAGPGEHNAYETGAEDYIWGQFNTFSYKSSLGGPSFSSFFVGDEILQKYSVSVVSGAYVYNVTGSTFEGMGVFCHEFGHALGLPDFYNTSSGAGVVDFWSVMDYGQYWRNGYRPLGYNAYERNFMGWLKINDLGNDPQTLTIYPIGSADNTEAQAYRIVNPSNDKEYYILENRQAGTWYPSELGTGLLIYHVDYLASAWSGNSLNRTASHPRLQVLPADGTNQVFATLRNNGLTSAQAYEQFQGDVFPGTSAVSSIASFSTFTGSGISTPIYNIAENSDNTITLQYLDLPSPVGKFVRIKSADTDAYVGVPTNTTTPMVSNTNEAGIFYVTTEGQLVNFQNGAFVNEETTAYTKGQIGTSGSTYTYSVSAVSAGAKAGTYSIASGSNYMQATSEALVVAATGDAAAAEFYLEEVNELPLNINTAVGYATLNLPVPFSVPSDVTVLYASRVHDNLLTISEASTSAIAANVPVMIHKAGGGEITISLATSGSTIDGNLLRATDLGGTLIPSTDKVYIYALSDNGTSAYFRLLSDTDRGVAGFKAYYLANTAGSTPQYFYLDDAVTALTGLTTTLPTGTTIYDLQGRPVSTTGTLPAGIYIVKQGQTIRKVKR